MPCVVLETPTYSSSRLIIIPLVESDDPPPVPLPSIYSHFAQFGA